MTSFAPRSISAFKAWTLSAAAFASMAFGCSASSTNLEQQSINDMEDLVAVGQGAEDNFYSASAKEMVFRGTETVVLEDSYNDLPEAERLARAAELAHLKQTSIAWFLTQYLVTKSHDDANANYGGMGGIAKNNDYQTLNLRLVEGNTYAFDFTQIAAVKNTAEYKLPLRTNAEGKREMTLTVGSPSNSQLENLEYNSEWYRSAPWSGWNPDQVDASQKHDLIVTVEDERASTDAYFDFARMVEDGILDIDVHYGWDYHNAYHVVHAQSTFNYLVARGFTPPVASFELMNRESGAFTKTITANGRKIVVAIRLFYGQTGTISDPDTDEGGRTLENDMRESFRSRDVIMFSGHSGPFYGFALANWRKTSEGDLDDSEMAGLEMPSDRYQLVVAEGCDTYQIGAAFAANPNKPDLKNIDIITTTSFSNASTADTVQDILAHLTSVDSSGRQQISSIHGLMENLDGNSYYFDTMYGLHGIDDNTRLHPYANASRIGRTCRANNQCGGTGNLCVASSVGSKKQCTAICLDDSACPSEMRCAPVTSSTATTPANISVCVAR